MNKRQKLIIVLVIITSFIIGLFIGKFNIAQKILDQIKNKKNAKSEVIENDPTAYIHIHSPADVLTKRNELINYIWKSKGFPFDKMPKKTESNISDANFSKLKNLKQIDKYTVVMEHNVQSVIYLFRPVKSNGKLMIYHHGHVTGFDKGKDVIGFFLKNNFSVLGCSMPLCGMNNKPVVETSFGNIKLNKHADFQFLDSADFSTLHYFVEPVATVLNYLDKNFKFQSYSMIGISGGGWTTVMYPALDERIKKSYSVAGSAPIFLRTGIKGDFEQLLPELYRIADYLDLYIMDAFGDERKFVQIFNTHDPCCFSGENYKVYQQILTKSVENLGKGSFEMWFDEGQRQHAISENILERVLSDINQH